MTFGFVGDGNEVSYGNSPTKNHYDDSVGPLGHFTVSPVGVWGFTKIGDPNF